MIVGKKGLGDGYGIGSKKNYSIIEIARLLNMKYRLTAPKKGNRMDALLKTKKTIHLGWKEQHNLKDYMKTLHD